MPKSIEVALIGAGIMGSNHARVVANSPKAKLAIVIDPSKELGETLANQHQAIWRSTAVEIPNGMPVIIASPTETHFELALNLIECGHPLLVEKPLTDDIEKTKKLIDLSRKHNTVLVCGLLERFNPAILTAMEFIEDPRHIIASRHSPFTPRIKSHVAWDLMIHDVDLVLRFMKTNPSEIHSFSINQESPNKTPDISEALLKFTAPAISSISASRTGQRKIRKLSISEPGRLTEIDLLRRNVTIYHNVNESPLVNGVGYKQESVVEIPELISSLEPLTAQFENFIKLIKLEEDADIERNQIFPSHEVISKVAQNG